VQFIPMPSQSERKSFPVVRDNTITYGGIFGKNTSIEYSVLYSGFKEDIILDEYTGVSEFNYIINTNGMYVKNDNGRYFIIDPITSTEVHIGEVIIFDSVGKRTFGTMRIESIIENQQYLMTIIADKEFLVCEKTVYPVRVDPSVTIQSFTGNTKNILDATLYNNRPTVAAGGWNWIEAGFADSNFGFARIIMRFPGLMTFISNNNLQSSNITSAIFYLRVENSPQVATGINAAQFNGNASWNETSVTANTAPITSVGGLAASANIPINSANQWFQFNITSTVRNWTTTPANGNRGLILTNSSESAANRLVSFFSTEHGTSSSRPYLFLDYTLPHICAFASHNNRVCTVSTTCGAINNATSSMFQHYMYRTTHIRNTPSATTAANFYSNGPSGHGANKGLDITTGIRGAIRSYPIYAQGEGFVSDIGDDPDVEIGYTVVITYNNGWIVAYKHLEFLPPVSLFQSVSPSIEIGKTGNTGMPGWRNDPNLNVHLHIDVRVNGNYVNADSFFPNNLFRY